MVTTFNSNSKLRTKLETLLQLPLNQISYNNLVVDSSVLASAEPDHEHEHEREESAPVDDLDRDDTNSPTVTYSTRKNPTKHFNFDQKILYDDVIQVNCNSVVAELHKKKFGSGGKGRCIRVSAEGADKWMTPIEFETYCGKGNCRDWKRTLKAGGQQILAILDAGILTCHAVSCSCAVCNQNESLVGPIKPFMRYRRRKKDEIVAQNAFKKFLSLKPPTLITDLAFHSPQNSSSPMQKILNNMPKLNNPPLSINTQLNSTDDLVRFINKVQENDDNKWNVLEQMAQEMISQAKNLQSQIEIQRKESEVNRRLLIEKLLQTSSSAQPDSFMSTSSSSSSMTHSSRKRKLSSTQQYSESYDCQYDNEFVDECYDDEEADLNENGEQLVDNESEVNGEPHCVRDDDDDDDDDDFFKEKTNSCQ